MRSKFKLLTQGTNIQFHRADHITIGSKQNYNSDRKTLTKLDRNENPTRKQTSGDSLLIKIRNDTLVHKNIIETVAKWPCGKTLNLQPL